MAIVNTSTQYTFTGRAPLDTKALVKTYAELLAPATWDLDDGTRTAYNGMITAVWLNNTEPSKNGIYFLFDTSVTTSRKVPDVTQESNWHKLGEISELADFTARLSVIETSFADLNTRLTALEEKHNVLTYGYRSGFPQIGEPNKLYVAVDEQKSYVWHGNSYVELGVSTDSYEEPSIIYGGSAN